MPQAWLRRAGPLALHALVALHLLAPLLPARILTAQDLPNQVRHVYESALALREGQFPPLVAPELNGRRLHLFQLYSGTAYLVPGVLALVLDPYTALRLAAFAASLAAALALARAFERFTGDRWAASVGAAAFQLATFPIVDLHVRGSYTEWLALQLAALTLAAALEVLEGTARPALAFGLLVAAAALFLACHPLQTVLLGGTLALLVPARAWDLRAAGAWPRLGLVTLAAACAVALDAWFWLPILDTWDSQKMTTWAGAMAWGSAYTWLSVVLWLYPYAAPAASAWTPQLGGPLVLGLLALALLWIRGASRTAVTALVVTLSLVCVLGVISPRWLRAHHPEWVTLLGLKHFQYSYRLLLPAALLGSLALACAWRALRPLAPILSDQTAWRRASLAALALVTLHAAPYVWRPFGPPLMWGPSIDEVTADAFAAPDSSFYGLVGADFARLDWVRAGHLRLDEALRLPRAATPFEVRVETDPDLADLVVRAEGAAVPVSRSLTDGRARFEFLLAPQSTFDIAFGAPRPVPIRALTFRPQGDPGWLDLPAGVERDTGTRATWRARVRVPSAGAYQLPVAYFPDDRLRVNGAPARHASRDLFLVVLELGPGESVVEVETRANPRARAWSLLGLAGALAGVAVLARRPRGLSQE